MPPQGVLDRMWYHVDCGTRDILGECILLMQQVFPSMIIHLHLSWRSIGIGCVLSFRAWIRHLRDAYYGLFEVSILALSMVLC